jgi:hypothetical protein
MVFSEKKPEIWSIATSRTLSGLRPSSNKKSADTTRIHALFFEKEIEIKEIEVSIKSLKVS